MSIRQLAQRFAGIDTSFRCAERHVGEEFDETLPGIRHLDPDSACGCSGHHVDGAPEAAGEIAYQMENEIVSTDQREIDGHSAQVYSRTCP